MLKKELEVFLFNDQPTTCPLCGNRTEIISVKEEENSEMHVCLTKECQFLFIMKVDLENSKIMGRQYHSLDWIFYWFSDPFICKIDPHSTFQGFHECNWQSARDLRWSGWCVRNNFFAIICRWTVSSRIVSLRGCIRWWSLFCTRGRDSQRENGFGDFEDRNEGN